MLDTNPFAPDEFEAPLATNTPLLNPDEHPDQIILAEDFSDEEPLDQRYFEPRFLPCSPAEQTETSNALQSFADAIFASTAWEFNGVVGSKEKDSFIAYVLSRGLTLRVTAEDFGDIAEQVEVVASDDESAYVAHSIRYEGDEAGLQFFAHLLTTQLDRGTEGDTSIIKELGGPLMLLGLVASGSRWAKDMGLA